MTLIVSLRIPDGIVIAGDSLATMMNQMQWEGEIEVECPKCGEKHSVKQVIPLPGLPATTFSYAQKVFPFCSKYGVGTFGLGSLLGKSIYFLVRQLESQLTEKPDGATKVANIIGQHFHRMLVKQLELEGVNIEQIPEDQYPLGFQVVGYDEDTAVTVEVFIGKQLMIRSQPSPAGCTFSGQGDIVQAIWSLYANEAQQPPFQVFSLQDAIAYAEFLINATASHQQFAQTMATVGGDIDIGLVTPFTNFKWIRQKPLSKLLEDQ